MAETDLVPIRIDDPNCRGVTSSDGRVQYNKDARGRVYVPRAEARRILASGMRDAHAGELRAGMGVNPYPERQAAYDAWLREHPETFLPYSTWRRTVWTAAADEEGAR